MFGHSSTVPPSSRQQPPPSPWPQQKENELILFGGEWYDSEKDKTHVYADLFVLDVEKVAWRRIVSPKGPLPRSSHQSVMTKYHMYVFGGEFTSLNQEKFRHYKWVHWGGWRDLGGGRVMVGFIELSSWGVLGGRIVILSKGNTD